MNRFALGLTIGLLSGAALVATPPLVSEQIARNTSQWLYDCGIRVADEGVSHGRISGFDISGHHYGICVGKHTPGLVVDAISAPITKWDGNDSWQIPRIWPRDESFIEEDFRVCDPTAPVGFYGLCLRKIKTSHWP
jgi:hypothetical protein